MHVHVQVFAHAGGLWGRGVGGGRGGCRDVHLQAYGDVQVHLVAVPTRHTVPSIGLQVACAAGGAGQGGLG